MHDENLPRDTRTHILEIAWRLIGERQDAAVTLVDIAQAAGVSRQTLYVNFGSRAGLLTAMVAHHDEASAEPVALARARSTQPAAQALDTYIRAWFRYVPKVFPVARALAAASLTDEDARAAWDSRMQLVRGGLLELMQGLKRTGNLQAGWTPEAAADWCFSMLHVDTWQHLVIERHWKPTELAQRASAALRATLVREPPASGSG
jgi:AcrR family transcriptional regulator